MSRADDLVPLFLPPPTNELGFRQGTVISFDLSTGENVVDVGGTQLVNVPLLSVVESVSLLPGTVVALLTWKSSWWIIGRVITANSPGFGEFCVFENNGEGVCITANGIDIYPPNPPDDVARIFAQKFLDGRMWLEMIPPRTIGGTGDNRFILEGGSDLTSPSSTPGSFSLITAGDGNIDVGQTLTTFSDGDTNIGAAGNLTAEATGLGIYRSTGAVFLESFSAAASVLASTDVFIDAGSGSHVLSSGLNQCFIDHTTTASAANCFIAVNGLIQRSTSSKRYKVDIEDLVVDPDLALQLRPRTWRDRAEVAANPETTNWHVGFLAEEVDELGLTAFVEYDAEGRPEGLAYDRLSVALLGVLQSQNSRLAALETRVAALDGQAAADPRPTSTTPKPPRRPVTTETRPHPQPSRPSLNGPHSRGARHRG